MSNSSLVNYTAWSPHYDSRNGCKITDITIHHMAGNLSVETCGNVFKIRPASTHYGIGSDGRVGQYVDEKNMAWANANRASNMRSITIELANDKVGGDWHVSDTAIAKCIDLVVDICKRNNIKKLNYTGTPSGNLTRHNMFYPTGCPGPYLQSKFPYICEEVNKKLLKVQPINNVIFNSEDIKKLQKWFGIKQTGTIGGQVVAVKPYLQNIAPVTYKGGGSGCIKRLQKYLLKKGYNAGTVDGYFGKTTIKALQQFLKFKKSDVDGYFGPKTAKAFKKYLDTKNK